MVNKFGKKSCILLMLILCCCISGYAQSAVKMIPSEGKEVIFQLNDSPKVYILTGELVIETDTDRVDCPIGEGVKFEFIGSDETSVEEISIGVPVFKVNGNTIEASNLTPGSPVAVIDMSGKAVRKSNVSSTGHVAVNISDLPSGVYVFNSKDKNFKFYKK